ncbi:hypothetical protein V1515DRAFT_617856 [Lipomyces mesembrius]
MASPGTIPTCGRASVHSSVSTESGGSDGDRNRVAYAPLTPDTPPFPSEDTESSLPKKEPGEKSNKKNPSNKKKDTKEEVVRRRTRTGCLTCRKRRIKCDEGKPKCSNCTKSRRVCEGYGPRVDLRSPYFKVRSIVPLPNDHNNYAALMANGINPYAPYISPHFPPFGAPMHPDHLYAASNYYAAAATAAAAGAPYPDPAIYPPMPYMPMGYLPGSWATPGGPIVMQPVSSMTADPMTPQVLSTPDSGMPLPAHSYPYWMPQHFVPLPQHPQSEIPESSQSRLSLDDEVEFYSAGPDLPVPDHIVADLFAPPSPQTHTAMQGLAISPNETLTTYPPDLMKSPLMHADAPRMFRHLVHVLAPQISLFERHGPRPELLLPPARFILHYHLSIRRLARALHDRRTNFYGASDLPAFAASLVLTFYETAIGEHDKWARHLHGASNLIQCFDMRTFVENLDIVVEDETPDDPATLAPSEQKSHKPAAQYRASSANAAPRQCSCVLVANFIVRDSERKRGFTAALDIEASQFAAGESEFLEHTKAAEAGSCVSPFGPVIRYIGVQVAVVRMYYLMLRILKPAYKGGLANIVDVADKAGPLCALIGIVSQRPEMSAMPSETDVGCANEDIYKPTSLPTDSATHKRRHQVQARAQQHGYPSRYRFLLEQACVRTGWCTAFVIKAGLALIWSSMRDAGRIEPAY